MPGTPVRKTIRYHMRVEGFYVSGSTFYFIFTEAGRPVMMNAHPYLVTSEARAAAKKFRAEGLTPEDIKEAVKADLVSRGLPQASIDSMHFERGPGVSLVMEEPYVTYYLHVYYNDHEGDFGEWAYEFNGITGEMISRESLVTIEP